MDEKHILIVEDESQIAAALRRALEHGLDGYQVEISSLADEALTMLQHKQFALIVTDLCMPGMDGMELIRRVRQVSPQTRTMLITAYGSPEVESQARRLAAVYLPKPFTLQEFNIVVQGILDEEEGEYDKRQPLVLNEEELEITVK
jgi:two-component system response regulator PilR (NtrC family)